MCTNEPACMILTNLSGKTQTILLLLYFIITIKNVFICPLSSKLSSEPQQFYSGYKHKKELFYLLFSLQLQRSSYFISSMTLHILHIMSSCILYFGVRWFCQILVSAFIDLNNKASLHKPLFYAMMSFLITYGNHSLYSVLLNNKT